MKTIKYIVLSLIIIVLMFAIPYLIQFRFYFFGANMVTLKDILALYLIPMVIGILILIRIYINYVNNK